MKGPLLSVRSLSKIYQVSTTLFSTQELQALNSVSFDLFEGETLGIVGESGCGKSTLAKLLVGLERPSYGEIFIDHKRIDDLETIEKISSLQMIFQDPYSSLNPRQSAIQIVMAPLMANRYALREKIGHLLSVDEVREKASSFLLKVGIAASAHDKYPHQFSGGQRQRIGIARGLVLGPKILICDESVSALDVSIQAEILNLLSQLQKELNLTYIFISHDLSVVNYISHRVMVMYLGKIVEIGQQEDLLKRPVHPYTKSLLKSCYPKHFSHFKEIKFELPSPFDLQKGCAFMSRCPYAEAMCEEKVPPLLPFSNNQQVACFKAKEF